MLEVLFRPFRLKKWIMLFVIILLAGQMSGNFNVNIRGNRADFEKIINQVRKGVPIAAEAPALSEVAPQLQSLPKSPKTTILVTTVATVITLLITVFILLLMWVSSNFSFVFIDSIVKNDASLRVPFHRNKAQGNSYFRWNIVFALIGLLTFGIIIAIPAMQLIKSGVFSGIPVNATEILSIVFRYMPVLAAPAIIFFLVGFFTLNFILPIMYKKKISILKGWGVFLGLLRNNIW